MKAIKKLAVVMICLVVVLSIRSYEAQAEETAWNIENKVDKSECTQKEEILLSVHLKGNDASAQQNISSLSGTLEYDNSLFTVEKADILPVEGGKVQSVSFDKETGVFAVTYGANIAVKQEGLLVQLKLHVAADASLGRTTVCVTHMEWDTPDSQPVSVEHRIPVKLTIAEADVLLGDVNQDGKINLTDAKLVMQYYNGSKKLNSQQKKGADVNGDGKVNLIDAKLIMKYYNGEIAEF